MPAIPYFLLAFFPLILSLLKKVNRYLSSPVALASLLIVGVLITINFSADRQRHLVLHEDLIKIEQFVDHGEAIHLDGQCHNYEIKAFLSRYWPGNGSCSASSGFVISESEKIGCEKIQDVSFGYLYRCK